MDAGGRFCWFKQKCIRDELKDTVNYCVLTNKLSELMGDELIQLGRGSGGGGGAQNKLASRGKQTWCLTSTETARLVRDGEGGWRGMGGGGGEREIIYLSLHCHHQNDSCIKMGGDESHFIVSLILRAASTDHNF